MQYYARQNPQPQFVLPEGFRPTRQVTRSARGTRVHADRTPDSDRGQVTFDLTIDPNGEVRYVDNAQVDDLGDVDYRATRVTWQTGDPLETSAMPGTEETTVSDTEPNR